MVNTFSKDQDPSILREYLKRETLELTLNSFGCSTCMSNHIMATGSMQMLEWFVSHNPARTYTEWSAKWYCPAALHQTIEVPLTWWDQLKRAHAPAWFLKRWPWKKRVYKIMEMFPEISWPKHSGHKINVAILTDEYAKLGPDIVQHPPLVELFGARVSAQCAKCGKDLYCLRPPDVDYTISPGDRIAESMQISIMDHYNSGQCQR